MLRAGFLIPLLLILFLPSPVQAASNATTTGSITLIPTVECIGVTLNYTGDDNHNNSVVLQFRESGGSWITAPPMWADRSNHQYRGSIFWLSADTTYEVNATFSDGDTVSGTNPRTGTVTTHDDSPAIGTNHTYYVATTGNDNTGSGTIGSPWKTIQKAANSVVSGDTVYVRAGTYSEMVTISTSGTASNYITFMPYSGETAIINGSSRAWGFVVDGASYVRIRGFQIQDTAGSSEDAGAITFNDANFCIAEYNTTLNVGRNGDGAGAGAIRLNYATNCIVQYNTLTQNVAAAGDIDGVVLRYAGVGNVVRYNTISSSSDYWRDCIGNYPEDYDYSDYDRELDIYENILSGAGDDGIQTDGAGINLRVWSNTITPPFLCGISMCGIKTGPAYFFRNVVVIGSSANAAIKTGDEGDQSGPKYIYQNTFYATGSGADGIQDTDWDMGNFIFKNNIVYASRYVYEITSGTTTGFDMDYNNIYTSDGSRFTKWQNSTSGTTTFAGHKSVTGMDANSISVADNKFVNASGRDFTLQSNSPCIDKGTVLVGFNDITSPWPYSGSLPDLGAYEYGSGPANNPPVAANDTYSTNEDTALNVSAPGVLSNDTDADGNPLTAVLVATVSHGSLTLNSNGSFTYTPTANYNGTDTFTYRANDGTTNSNTATVTITINPVNDAPVAVNDAYTTTVNTALNVASPGVLSNDTDVDGNPLTAVLVATVSHGSLTLNSNGSFTYTPTSGYTGTDTFTYRANDGTVNSSTATVTITINTGNTPPVAVNDTYTTNQDTALNMSAPGVLSNDTDADGNPLTAVLVATVSHGSLTLNSNGSFTYTPTSGYTGTDTFTYRANDGTANSNTATVTITISGGNTPPVAVNDTYTTNEDTALNVSAPGVLSNDTDADGNPLTAALVATVSHGSVILNSNGSFSYTPAANYNGTDTFTYRANDGTANSNTATVTITINAVNDAPVAVADSYTTAEDTVLNVAAPGVLSNDTDVEGSTLTATRRSNPSHGTVTLNSDGSFTYTPTANYNGTDSFNYRARDGQANSNTVTVTITITAVNDAPVAVNDAYTTAVNTALNVAFPGVLSNDTDIDGNPLTAVLVATVSHGSLTLNSNGSFIFTPTSGYAGTDTFTYRANDGTANSNTATVTITINSVNNAPVAVNDAYTTPEDTVLNVTAPGVLNNDTDADGDPLTAVKISDPANGTVTLNGNGSFSYTPAANYNGTDTFSYQANDGQANSNVAIITITITPVNDAPVLNPIGDKTIQEGQTLSFDVSAIDPDNDSMTYSAENVPVGASFNVNTQDFSWPDASPVGTYTGVRFNVTDGHLTTSEDISITVEGTPENPPSGAGSGGGGGGSGTSGGSSASGITSLRYSQTSDGTMVEDVTAGDLEMKVMLIITRGTIVRNKNGQTVTSINIKPETIIRAASAGSQIIGQSYEIEPGGTTFDASATLVFRYFESSLPADVPATNLYIVLWDPDTMSWQDIGGEVDTTARTVSVPITHLSVYALAAHTRPADLLVSPLSVTPGTVNLGDSVVISTEISNQGDLTGTGEVCLKLDGVTIQTNGITLSGGDSEKKTFTILADACGEHCVSIGSMLAYFMVSEPPAPANFTLSGLDIDPLPADAGETVNINVSVQNTGDLSGQFTVTLMVDDTAVDNKVISLDGGSSETVSFSFVSDTAGMHTVNIGNLAAELEVVSLAQPAVVSNGYRPS
jgi:VCBS repeat-containing protein